MTLKIKVLGFFILLFTIYTSIALAQNGVGINTTTPQAALEVVSTSTGILIPRMTSAQRLAISSPPTASLVYQTDGTAGFYYYDGSVWRPLLSNAVASNGGWSLTGNAGTSAGTNFIGTTDAQAFAINTFATERVRVLSSGSVGIGTAAPTSLLGIVTNTDGKYIHMRYSDSSAPLEIGGIAYTGIGAWAQRGWFGVNLNTPVGSPVQFNTSGPSWYLDLDNYYDKFSLSRIPAGGSATSFITVLNSGNVGMGTATPQSLLHLYASTPSFIINSAKNSDGVASTISFKNSGASLYDLAKFEVRRVDGFDNRGEIEFSTYTGAGWNSDMYIDYLGNVGIGTSDPGAPLHINRTGAGNALGYLSATGTGSAGIYLDASNGDFIGVDYAGFLQNNDLSVELDNFGNNPLHLRTNDLTRMTIVGNGNVGIGTTNPLARLALVGGSTMRFGNDGDSGDNSIYLRGGTLGDKARITLNHYSYADWHIAAGDAGNGLLSITNTQGGTDGIVINTAGKVGIGTNNPSHRLFVNGVIRAGNMLSYGTSLPAVNAGTTANVDVNIISLLDLPGPIAYGTGEILYHLYINGGGEGFMIYKVTFGGYLDPTVLSSGRGWAVAGNAITTPTSGITINSVTLAAPNTIRLNITNTGTGYLDVKAGITFTY